MTYCTISTIQPCSFGCWTQFLEAHGTSSSRHLCSWQSGRLSTFHHYGYMQCKKLKHKTWWTMNAMISSTSTRNTKLNAISIMDLPSLPLLHDWGWEWEGCGLTTHQNERGPDVVSPETHYLTDDEAFRETLSWLRADGPDLTATIKNSASTSELTLLIDRGTGEREQSSGCTSHLPYGDMGREKSLPPPPWWW